MSIALFKLLKLYLLALTSLDHWCNVISTVQYKMCYNYPLPTISFKPTYNLPIEFSVLDFVPFVGLETLNAIHFHYHVFSYFRSGRKTTRQHSRRGDPLPPPPPHSPAPPKPNLHRRLKILLKFLPYVLARGRVVQNQKLKQTFETELTNVHFVSSGASFSRRRRRFGTVHTAV